MIAMLCVILAARLTGCAEGATDAPSPSTHAAPSPVDAPASVGSPTPVATLASVDTDPARGSTDDPAAPVISAAHTEPAAASSSSGEAAPSATTPRPVEAAPDPAPAAQSKSPLLTPLGGVNWHDSFQQALRKVEQLPGVTDVSATLVHRRVPAGALQGEQGLQNWFGRLFAEGAQYRRLFIERDPVVPRPIYTLGGTGVAILEANSLQLAGVSCRLKVHFTIEKGLMIADPQRVTRQTSEFFGPQSDVDVPLVLNSLEVLPASTVSPHAYLEIARSLMQKYEPLRTNLAAFPKIDLDDPGVGYLFSLSFADAAGNTLELYPGGKLLYRNGETQGDHSLGERYRQRKVELEEQSRRQRIAPGRDLLNDL
jgi:hypothetical protein